MTDRQVLNLQNLVSAIQRQNKTILLKQKKKKKKMIFGRSLCNSQRESFRTVILYLYDLGIAVL